MSWRDWLGVGERRWKKAPDEEVQPSKTLWDWLQLLIVPAILIGVTFVWSETQARSDNRREDRRIAADRAAAEEARRDATLQAYLDQMSRLMLDRKLLTSKEGDAVRAVARTVTLTALRRLDGGRRAQVARFLYEARLVRSQRPRISLLAADLGGAQLRYAFLIGVNLDGANLAGADLASAHLEGARLNIVDLPGADLTRSNLTGAHLIVSNLQGADLGGANLKGADLGGAFLARANLRGANLASAHLKGAHLSGAYLDGAKNLDLGRFMVDLPPIEQKRFLDSQKAFLDSLSREELAKFNLSPEKLATFRREARGA
jgi:uncharacterized protein YjbI with pentapeptide repeats